MLLLAPVGLLVWLQKNNCAVTVRYLASGIVCVLLSAHRPLPLMTSSQRGLVLLYAGQLQRAMMDYMMGNHYTRNMKNNDK